MSLKVLLTSACLLLMGIVAIAYGRSKETPLQRAVKQTVLISNDSLQGVGRGTGILLDSTHVLTCAHLSHDSKDRYLVYTYPLKEVITGRWEARSEAEDLMILILDSSATVTSTPIFEDSWTLGEPVYVIGQALGGMEWFVSHGVISGEDHEFLLTDAVLEHGNSGGPWINEQGAIIAMSDWLLPETGVRGGISAKVINHFLERYKHRNDLNDLLKMLGGQ